jgi:alcohol dehydrogenase class IV
MIAAQSGRVVYDLEHAATHAVVLPHVAGFNLPAAPDAARRLGVALGDIGKPFRALLDLYARLDAPRSLGALGLAADDVEHAAELVMAHLPPSNPRPVTRAELLALLGRACRGDAGLLVPLPG